MSKYKVVITDGYTDLEQELEILGSAGCELVVANSKTPEDVIAVASDADAILNGDAPVDEKVIANLKKCRIIVRGGAGYDTIDVEAASKKKIAVCNVPGATTDEVADHSIALALSLARRLIVADRKVRQGEWNVTKDAPIPAFEDTNFVVLGAGRIGQAVLERARPFKFRLAAYDPNESVDFSKMKVERVAFDEALQRADILSIHIPLAEETRHLLDAKAFLKMKPGVIIVNTGRGELIDTEALIAALKSGHVAFAGLDVFEEEPLPKEHPLCELENVILTPHIGAHSAHSAARVTRLAAEEILRGLRGEKLQNQVN